MAHYLWLKFPPHIKILRGRNTHVENKLMVTKGERRGGINWEIGIDLYILLILYRKWINSKDPLYSTGILCNDLYGKRI